MGRTKRGAQAVPPREYVEEEVEALSLKPHTRNYKAHPPEQIAHIRALLRKHGFFKNVVAARDGTLLAGHGVVQAAKEEWGDAVLVPIRRYENLDPDSPEALKIVAADNELPKFGDVDDRALAELLRDVQLKDPVGLLGTGYDERSLAAFLMVTRPASEIRDLDEAAEYVGMPEYDGGEAQIKLIVTFPTEQDRKRYVDAQKMKIVKIAGLTWSTRWPEVENEDVHSLRFAAKR